MDVTVVQLVTIPQATKHTWCLVSRDITNQKSARRTATFAIQEGLHAMKELTIAILQGEVTRSTSSGHNKFPADQGSLLQRRVSMNVMSAHRAAFLLPM
jgi:hypothetical protein